jgi:hypothetical protein
LALAGCGGDSPTDPIFVGPEGGQLVFEGGRVRLAFPQGAVGDELAISVQATGNFPNVPTIVTGTTYRFLPEEAAFDQQVQVTIRYDPANLPAGAEENALKLHEVVGGEWQEIPGSIVDEADNTVTTLIAGFSVLGILWVPPLPDA